MDGGLCSPWVVSRGWWALLAAVAESQNQILNFVLSVCYVVCCYANAVLQCLAFTSPSHAYFLQGLHLKACVKKEWCFTCELESLELKAKEGSFPLSPIKILSQLQNIGSQLGNGREEDAHEFQLYAIDTMQSACLKEARIKCAKCQGKFEHHERMMDLTVEIEGDIGTLEEALKQFTATETLDGENKY
ncbi:hypothetical protein SO802_019282 [Lithocarpus litseifolius]|uniref:USP domain-containing protein n=1 Tax=Lithocarpus litseifolius TaxID=425828 RepID=A0AAW2CSG3_9ROSI